MPATIVIPYVSGRLRPETLNAALGQDLPVRAELLEETNDYAYAGLLRREWRKPGSTILLEQDVVPAPGQLRELAGCWRDWCTVPVSLGRQVSSVTLSLVKFSDELKRQYSSLMVEATASLTEPGRLRHWRSCDMGVLRQMNSYGVTRHEHRPAARHLHYQDAIETTSR